MGRRRPLQTAAARSAGVVPNCQERPPAAAAGLEEASQASSEDSDALSQVASEWSEEASQAVVEGSDGLPQVAAEYFEVASRVRL